MNILKLEIIFKLELSAAEINLGVKHHKSIAWVTTSPTDNSACSDKSLIRNQETR